MSRERPGPRERAGPSKVPARWPSMSHTVFGPGRRRWPTKARSRSVSQQTVTVFDWHRVFGDSLTEKPLLVAEDHAAGEAAQSGFNADRSASLLEAVSLLG